MTTISYVAHNTMRAFHRSDAHTRCLVGPIRSGRTTAALVELISRAAEQAPDADNVRRTRWAVCASSSVQLRSSVIPVWQTLAPESSFGGIDNMTHTIARKLPDGTTTHTEVLFLSAGNEAEASRLASLKLTGAILSGENIHPSAPDYLRASLGLYPERPTFYGTLIESIWPDSNYWLHTMVTNPLPGTRVFIQTAGDSTDAENLDALPDGYYQRLIEVNTQQWSNRHIRVRPASTGTRVMDDLELWHRLQHMARTSDPFELENAVRTLGDAVPTITVERMLNLKDRLQREEQECREVLALARA